MSSTDPNVEPVDVSISILSWNAKSWLRRTLASLYQPDDAEVLQAWERADPELARELIDSR